MKKKNFFLEHKQFTIFFILALAIAGVAIFAPWIAPKDPLEAVMTDSLKAPCKEYPLGADKLGRDLLSRVIYGTRTSLVYTLILVATIFVTGTVLGIIAGYFGGWIDQIIMRVADMMISFPGMILAIAIAGMLGASLRNGVIAITAVSWPKYARLARSIQHADDHDGDSGGGYGNDDAGAGIALLPRFWRGGAHAGMGTDAERRKNLYGESSVADDRARYRYCNCSSCI